MQIKEIENKEEWDNFVMKQPFYTFMNSWDWGEFNKRMGCKPPHLDATSLNTCAKNADSSRCGGKIFRLGFYDEERLAGLALFIKVEARRGTHLFCPYGPVFDKTSLAVHDSGWEGGKGGVFAEQYTEKLAEIMPEIIKLARKENVCFIRVSPLCLNPSAAVGRDAICRDATCQRQPAQAGRQVNRVSTSGNVYNEFKNLGFKFAPMHVHAEDNWLLDITKPEDELLKNMRKTTRYLIKRAIKEGVKVFKNNSEEYIDKFIKMHKNHASRDNGGYTAFSEKYIKTLFEVFPEDDINLMCAEYKLFASRTRTTNAGHPNDNAEEFDNIEAMLVSIKYGKTAAYYLGASDIRHPKFSPAYLLQWESIKKARDAGCEIYNFWGVAPDDNPKHPLAGVSLFKKGFGGYSFNLAHAQDIPLTWKYWINWGVESARRVRRGYYYKF